jgi:deoxyribodipyrimidine photo-lyase
MSVINFPPESEAVRRRIASIDPHRYARTRNALDGAVSRLSPYITHGYVTLPEVLTRVLARHPLAVRHRFVCELGWREYFHHVWTHRGDGIFTSLHEGVLPEDAYAGAVPDDIREGRTGVPVIDRAVRELYATGYLHNHARLWLASYVVHLRKIHWRAGADWLYAHLLDGDLASNHLSWQWVAGTASRKPYLFNADNVAKYAPADWHSAGTVLDADYGTLERLARDPACTHAPDGRTAVTEPPRVAAPPACDVVDPHRIAGRDVWLVHPWALHEPPPDLGERVLPVAVTFSEVHANHPWSPSRWAFVTERLRTLAVVHWHADAKAIAAALVGARSVHAAHDPHLNRRVAGLLREKANLRGIRRLFPDVPRSCSSFSQWWTRATRGLRDAAELPGLAPTTATVTTP